MLERMRSESYDVAIIGGGPAGLSAALVLGRARRRVVVVDAGAPRNAPAAHMQGFLSRDGTSPAELLQTARAEVRHYCVEIINDSVVDAATVARLHRPRRAWATRLLLLVAAVVTVLSATAATPWGQEQLAPVVGQLSENLPEQLSQRLSEQR